ncbi:hypothetical protein MMC18_005951 [Xylographa bjoerkii]|nr:hypothetical protein [Xylographa bjoerkii]
MASFRNDRKPPREPYSAAPAILMETELWPSQQSPMSLPLYTLPRSCLKARTTSDGSREKNKLYVQATGHMPSNLPPQFSPANTGRTRESSLPDTLTPTISLTSEPSQRRPSEVDEILEKLGHPNSLVGILTNKKATTREDLLSVLRDEARRIRSNLGLEAWDEEQESNRCFSEDKKMGEGEAEQPSEHGGSHSKVEKLKSTETVLFDIGVKAECTPVSNSSNSGSQPTSGTLPVASSSVSRRRPAALNLRQDSDARKCAQLVQMANRELR